MGEKSSSYSCVGISKIFPRALKEVFTALDLVRGKILWRLSYEKLVFYHLSYWPHHRMCINGINLMSSDFPDVLINCRTTGTQELSGQFQNYGKGESVIPRFWSLEYERWFELFICSSGKSLRLLVFRNIYCSCSWRSTKTFAGNHPN